MTARAFRLRAPCCFYPSVARRAVSCCATLSRRSKSPCSRAECFPRCARAGGLACLAQAARCVDACVYGQTFDLWCSILARSRGTVLLIFGIDPASGPASQIQKVRARAERRIAFPLRPMLCPHRKPLRGGFLPAASSSRTWTLRTAREFPAAACSLYLGTNSVRLQCCRRRGAGRRIPRQSDRQRALPRCAERFLDCARARSAAANLSERCGRCSRFCFRSARGASVDPAIAIAILEDGKQRGRNARPRDGRRSGEREGF